MELTTFRVRDIERIPEFGLAVGIVEFRFTDPATDIGYWVTVKARISPAANATIEVLEASLLKEAAHHLSRAQMLAEQETVESLRERARAGAARMSDRADAEMRRHVERSLNTDG